MRVVSTIAEVQSGDDFRRIVQYGKSAIGSSISVAAPDGIIFRFCPPAGSGLDYVRFIDVPPYNFRWAFGETVRW